MPTFLKSTFGEFSRIGNPTSASPPFLFTYWNPLGKDSNLVKSWFDYVKDVSLANYTADSVGQYIQQASSEQVSAIDSTGRRICGQLYDGFFSLQGQMGGISAQLGGLAGQMEQIVDALQGVNQRLALVVDEAKTSNLLQENMAELLRIPDSQKQRYHHIELGLKFLKNALIDEDLYQDALRELLEAEHLMHADYFVLHRIGMIYLYVPALGNLEKAVDYFTRAGKYAFVESAPEAARLCNILNKTVNKRLADQPDQSNADIRALAGESYLNGATGLYALGRFEEAVKLAEKAVNCQPNEAKNCFFLAKYNARAGNPDVAVAHLKRAIEFVPEMAMAAVSDCDLNQVPLILDLLNRLDADLDAQIQRAIPIVSAWPKSESRQLVVETCVSDAHLILENGNYVQKRIMADKLIKFEVSLPIAVQLVSLAAFGVEFDKSLAEQLLQQSTSENVLNLWNERRKTHFPLNPHVKALAQKANLDSLELVLLATADKSNFGIMGSVRWSFRFGICLDNFAIGVDGTVYTGSRTGIVYAFNGQTGWQLWKFNTGDNDWSQRPGVSHPAIGSDGNLYVGSYEEYKDAGRICALDSQTGNKIYELNLGHHMYDPPTIGSDGTLYIRSGNRIYAFAIASKIKLWEIELESWFSEPAIGTDGNLYISSNGTVYCLASKTGNIIWKSEGLPHDRCTPVIGIDGIIYFVSSDCHVWALDGNTGEDIWSFADVKIGSSDSTPIIGADGKLYVGSDDGKVYALDGKTGEKIWEFEAGGKVSCPCIDKSGKIYLASMDHKVYALDAQSGVEIWKFEADCALYYSAIGADGTLYVGGESIYAINTFSGGAANSPWPMYRQNAQRTGCSKHDCKI